MGKTGVKAGKIKIDRKDQLPFLRYFKRYELIQALQCFSK